MFRNNKIFILGFARSGYEAAKILISRGNIIVLNDSKPENDLDKDKIAELKKLGVTLILGSHPDEIFDDSFDYLVKSPGVAIDHKYVLKARKLGIEVVNEAEIAYRLLPKDVKLIGITGTNGKTTTTTLTYEILKKAYGNRVHLAGNIGYPLCGVLNDLKKDDIIVMEVSCQQLENFSLFKPDIAVMTNLSPAHVDFFHSYDAYKKVKVKLFSNQTKMDVAILNIDNADVVEETKNIKALTKYFSSSKEISGCYIRNGAIYYYENKVIDINEILLVGRHNLENIMASIMVCKELDVSNDVITAVLKSFKGVEHRLEYVDTVKGVKYYNDTEATNIKCTQIALSSFQSPIILILGGLERGQDFNELTPFMKNVKTIVGIGQCRNRVEEYGKSLGIPTYIYEHLSEGFSKCVFSAQDGDVVLLSPASASWDQYKECEVRGKEFKEKVGKLKNEN